MNVDKQQFFIIKNFIDNKNYLGLKNFCEDNFSYSNSALIFNYHGIACLNLNMPQKSLVSFKKALELSKNINKIPILKNLVLANSLLHRYEDIEKIILSNLKIAIYKFDLMEELLKANNFTKNNSNSKILNEIESIKILKSEDYNFIKSFLINLIKIHYTDLVYDYLEKLEMNKVVSAEKYKNSLLIIFYYEIEIFDKCLSFLKKNNDILEDKLKYSFFCEIYRYLNQKIKSYRYYIKYFLLSKDTGALLSLVGMFKFKNKEYKTLKYFNQIDLKKCSNSQLSKYYFALSKIEEDKKFFDLASNYLKKANEYQKKEINFNPKTIDDEIQFYRKKFNNNFYVKFKDFGENEHRPIFILGLPRSGSTLIEQIISSHNQVIGFGEQKVFNRNFKYFFNIFSKQKLDEDIDNITPQDIKKIGKLYCSNIKRYNGSDSLIFTDKMPFNFYYLGLIKTVMSKSKIIITKRSLKDNFLSIFKNFFSDPYLNFAYSEKDICDYFEIYVKHMNYYTHIFNDIYIVNYERVVSESEIEIKKLVRYCDLDWDENCMEFYKNNKIVTTVSSDQVRKKIYRSSMDSFNNYKFKNILERLNDIENNINF